MRAHQRQQLLVDPLLAPRHQHARHQGLLGEGARRVAHHALLLGKLTLKIERVFPVEIGVFQYGGGLLRDLLGRLRHGGLQWVRCWRPSYRVRCRCRHERAVDSSHSPGLPGQPAIKAEHCRARTVGAASPGDQRPWGRLHDHKPSYRAVGAGFRRDRRRRTIGRPNIPDKPIKIIVPFAPGGSTDILARMLGQKMTEAWGQQVVVETRPGAATGDRHCGCGAWLRPTATRCSSPSSNLATSPALHESLAVTIRCARTSSRSACSARSPIVFYTIAVVSHRQNLEGDDPLRRDHADPAFGSAGVASMTHLAAENFKASNGVNLMQHIVYRGGGPALNDVLSGQIPMTAATVTQALPQWQGGLVQGARHHRARSDTVRCRACTGISLAGLRYRCERVVRPVRAEGYAEADHRQAQRRDEAHPGDGSRRARLGARSGILDARGARHVRQKRDRALDPGHQEIRTEGAVSRT